MLPALARIISCPHCGGEKKIMSLLSGNSIDAERWSDAKFIAPMFPIPSPVQKCPHCGKYYFMPFYRETRESDSYDGELGLLNYHEWKEAYHQFCENLESPENICKVNRIKLNDVRFWILQSYNDYYYRENKGQPSAEEFEFVKSMAIKFIEEKAEDINPLVKAEIYREVNEMQKCAETLSSVSTEQFNDYQMKIYCGIKERLEKGDNKVFRI